MSSPTRGQVDLRVAERVRPGVEERRHQRVGVEVAAEVELRAVVPAGPDGTDGQDELAHAGRRVRPLHAEPLGDVRLDLRAEAEQEAALRRTTAGRRRSGPGSSGCGRRRPRCRCPAATRSVASAASSSGKNGSCDVSAAPQPVVARLLGGAGRIGCAGEPGPDPSVDLHGAHPTGGSGHAAWVPQDAAKTLQRLCNRVPDVGCRVGTPGIRRGPPGRQGGRTWWVRRSERRGCGP